MGILSHRNNNSIICLRETCPNNGKFMRWAWAYDISIYGGGSTVHIISHKQSIFVVLVSVEQQKRV